MHSFPDFQIQKDQCAKLDLNKSFIGDANIYTPLSVLMNETRNYNEMSATNIILDYAFQVL